MITPLYGGTPVPQTTEQIRKISLSKRKNIKKRKGGNGSGLCFGSNLGVQSKSLCSLTNIFLIFFIDFRPLGWLCLF